MNIFVFSDKSFIVKEKPSRALAGGGSYWRPFVCERGNRKGGNNSPCKILNQFMVFNLQISDQVINVKDIFSVKGYEINWDI